MKYARGPMRTEQPPDCPVTPMQALPAILAVFIPLVAVAGVFVGRRV